jgi:hypothetical protein
MSINDARFASICFTILWGVICILMWRKNV